MNVPNKADNLPQVHGGEVAPPVGGKIFPNMARLSFKASKPINTALLSRILLRRSRPVDKIGSSSIALMEA